MTRERFWIGSAIATVCGVVLGVILLRETNSTTGSIGEQVLYIVFPMIWVVAVYTAGLGVWKKIGLLFLGISVFQGLSRILTGDRYHVGSTLLGALMFSAIVLLGLPYGIGKFVYLMRKSLST